MIHDNVTTATGELRREIELKAGEIVESFGPDVDEALGRYERAGADTGGHEARIWVSVAFALGRLRRFTPWNLAQH